MNTWYLQKVSQVIFLTCSQLDRTCVGEQPQTPPNAANSVFQKASWEYLWEHFFVQFYHHAWRRLLAFLDFDVFDGGRCLHLPQFVPVAGFWYPTWLFCSATWGFQNTDPKENDWQMPWYKTMFFFLYFFLAVDLKGRASFNRITENCLCVSPGACGPSTMIDETGTLIMKSAGGTLGSLPFGKV